MCKSYEQKKSDPPLYFHCRLSVAREDTFNLRLKAEGTSFGVESDVIQPVMMNWIWATVQDDDDAPLSQVLTMGVKTK